MVTNTHVDLSRTSQIRIDAINTIKYTLLLDYKIPEYNTQKKVFLSNVFNNCQKCCYGLFYNTALIGKNNEIQSYNFFGIKEGYSNKLQTQFQDFGKISSKVNVTAQSDPITHLHNFILQHCVMSSYHAILTELELNKTINSEDLIINTKHLNYNRKEKIREKNPKSTEKTNFNKTSSTHFAALPFLENLIVLDKEETIFAEQFAEWWYHICGFNSRKLKSIFLKRENRENKNENVTEETKKELTQKEIEKFFIQDREESSINMLFPKYSESTEIDNNDKPMLLYHYYLTENIFNFRLFYCTLKAIDFVNQSNMYRLDQMDLIRSLISVTTLPNVFSRQLFLMYAILNIEQNVNSNKDFWYFQSLEYNKDNDIKYSVFDLYKWSRQLELFSNYFSNFIIPVYEWCFIGMLFEGIESVNGERHKCNLITAKEILEEFMIENFDCFISPYIEKENSFSSKFSKSPQKMDEDMLNFKNDMSQIYFKSDISTEYLTKLFNSFFYELRTKSSDIELNLSTKLKPDYFKKERHNQYSNFSDEIRLFYLNLLRRKNWE